MFGRNQKSLMRWPAFGSVCIALLLLFSGCTVTLISQYDEFTDQGVAELQKDVDTFLIGLERNQDAPLCTYSKNQTFYVSAFASVSSLQVRNEGRPKNSITNKQLGLLEDSLETLEKLHRVKGDSKCLSPAELKPIRNNINASFAAILKLELAKKRGEKGGQS